ncbi:MAG: alpha-amylase, partial [Ruminococcus sp.]|nr:alpha-amylase [Ruminococcus sp.]
MKDIAEAGYTAVQTSPVQPPKDYNSSWTDSSKQWWKLYQPLGLRVADGDTWLGTKTELKAMCDEAEKYGIKVIVDIVANHLANKGPKAGTYENLSPDVDDEMKNPDYYHSDKDGIDESNRYHITQFHMGQPDLNTGNRDVQDKVKRLLRECYDLGVDGFRFDAAKHIEVPNDEYCGSDFWPNVLSDIKEYSNNSVFLYGEILGYAGTDISNYTEYMAVTDNETGNNARSYVVSNNCDALKNDWYSKNTAAANCVLWAESHDTYMDNSTSGISDDVITKTWAIVGSRSDSTSLFLARPA